MKVKASKKAKITPLKGFKDAVMSVSAAPKLAKRVWPPAEKPPAKVAPARKAPRRLSLQCLGHQGCRGQVIDQATGDHGIDPIRRTS